MSWTRTPNKKELPLYTKEIRVFDPLIKVLSDAQFLSTADHDWAKVLSPAKPLLALIILSRTPVLRSTRNTIPS